MVDNVSPVILLMGPTAAGKTDLALRWAERLPLEIVSVDSAMIYRGMDIGTGKPSHELLRQVPHHLVDIRDPSETYSAGQFVRDARRCIAEIRSRGKTPLLVGGTMLYFRALLYGLAELPEADRTVRAEIDAQASTIGWPAMHALLADIDPQAAARIMKNDAQRIQRALEVHRITGTTLSELHSSAKEVHAETYLSLVWSPSGRAALHDRIARRFRTMMAMGFLDEVRSLHERKDLSLELPALRSVGYRQLLAYLNGEWALPEAIERGIVATRQLARRQLIWLRGMSEPIWYDSLEPTAAARIEESVRAALH